MPRPILSAKMQNGKRDNFSTHPLELEKTFFYNKKAPRCRRGILVEYNTLLSMKKKFREYSKIIALVVCVLLIAGLDTYGMPSMFQIKRVQVQDTASIPTSEPVVKTESTPNSNFTSVTLPENYNGEVTTTCDGNVCKTNTRKYTEEEIKKMHDDAFAQQKAMQEYMIAQQKYFDSIFKNPSPFPRFPLFPL